MGEVRKAHRSLVAKLEGKRPHGRPRRGWESNIKTDYKIAESEGVGWIHLAQERHSGSIKDEFLG
jgi:hypothetical protein